MVQPGDAPAGALPRTCWILESPLVAVVRAAGVPAMPVMPSGKPSAWVLGKERADLVLDHPGGPGRLAAKPSCFLGRAYRAGEFVIERIAALLKRCRDRLHAPIGQSEILALLVQTSLNTSKLSSLQCAQKPQHPARTRLRVSAGRIELCPRAPYMLLAAFDVAHLNRSAIERVVECSERSRS